MQIRIGLPGSFDTFSAVARDIGAPVLISANAFWQHARKRFWIPRRQLFNGVDLAIDSAGFVAMLRYWHYRWPLYKYVDFVKAVAPTWWAAPDYCCEREIAWNRAEVLSRVTRTAFKLEWTRQVAADTGVPPPMPVLQGWLPDDYERCADMSPDLHGMIGVGSVCRRPLHGPDGLFAVVERLDRILPTNVTLHLFGVKGNAISALASHPRVVSIDSQAWDYAGRLEKKGSFTIEYRSECMRRWAAKQSANLSRANGTK